MGAMRAVGVLAAAEALGFAVFGAGVGFYHDDWVLLEQMSVVQGFWQRCRALSWLTARPLDILLYPALYAVAGMNAAAQLALRLGVNVACAALFYLLVERLTRLRTWALLGAALALLIPNHEAVHLWFGIACEPWATLLIFASLCLALDWTESGSRAKAAAAQGLYLASLLLYEALAFMPLAPAAALAARRLAGGAGAKDVLRETRRFLLPYGVTLAAALLWQRVGVSVLLGTPNPKKAALSPLHVAAVYVRAVECLSNNLIALCGRSLRDAWRAVPPALWLLAVAAAGAGGWLLTREGDQPRREDRAAAWALAVALFAAAYAPYALSADYSPAMTGVMSRTNSGGAWAGGLLFAALALAAGRRRAWALGLCLFFFVVADWDRELQWARSWTLQQRIMETLHARQSEIPHGATVLLAGVPEEVGGAVVFQASYDFDGALRVATGRADLTGDVLGRVHRPTGERNVVIFHFPTGRLAPPLAP